MIYVIDNDYSIFMPVNELIEVINEREIRGGELTASNSGC